MSDEDLVRSVLKGDHEVFRVLVDRYAPMIFHALRQRGCPEAEVEDLAQDVFVRAFEGLGSFRGDASLSSWLYQIAANLSTDRLRRARRSEAMKQVELISEDLPSPAENQTLEDAELAERVRNALDLIPARYAEPFRLLYEDELTYDEIARQLDITPNALRVRVHRARAQLRVHLADVL